MGISRQLLFIQEGINVADTVLSLEAIEDLMWLVTLRILNYSDTEPNQDKIRIAWPQSGAPAWKITEDICFIRVNGENSPVTQQRDVNYHQKDVDNAQMTIGYTRYHVVQWTLYGPNSYERADTIRNALFLPQHKQALREKNLYIVPPISVPKRTPELFDGQWWPRVDFIAAFNEAVQRETEIPYIKSADIQIKESR